MGLTLKLSLEIATHEDNPNLSVTDLEEFTRMIFAATTPFRLRKFKHEVIRTAVWNLPSRTPIQDGLK